MAKEKEYYVSGVIEYASVVSTYVKATSKKQAKELALQEFREQSESQFPEMIEIIVDTPYEEK